MKILVVAPFCKLYESACSIAEKNIHNGTCCNYIHKLASSEKHFFKELLYLSKNSEK